MDGGQSGGRMASKVIGHGAAWSEQGAAPGWTPVVQSLGLGAQASGELVSNISGQGGERVLSSSPLS